MRCELVMPFQFARVRLQRQDRRGVQIVALSLVPVVSRIRITDAPEQRVGFGVVSARHPGRAASPELRERSSFPGFGFRLARQRNSPEPPGALAGGYFIRREKSAPALWAASHASDHEILEY